MFISLYLLYEFSAELERFYMQITFHFVQLCLAGKKEYILSYLLTN